MGISAALRPVTIAANILGGIIASTEKLDKVSKLFISIFDGFQLLFSGEWLAPIGALRGRLEAFSKLVGAVNLINRIKEWICVDETLKGTPDEGKRFWQAKKTTWYKIGGRLTLTVAQAIDTLKFIDAMGILKLGKIAAYAVGNVPVLNLIKDSFIIVSSGCTIIDSGLKLRKSQAAYHKLTSKREIWKDISNFYASSEKVKKSKHEKAKVKLAAKENKIVNKLIAKYKCSNYCDAFKVNRYEEYVYYLENGDLKEFLQEKPRIRLKELNQRNLDLEAEKKAMNEGCKEYNKLDADQTVLKKKIERMKSYDTSDKQVLAAHKFKVYVVRATNLGRERMKPWLDIANSVAKIAIICLSTAFLALGWASLPFTLTLWAVGLVVSAVGMKFLYDDIYKEKLKEPVFVKV